MDGLKKFWTGGDSAQAQAWVQGRRRFEPVAYLTLIYLVFVFIPLWFEHAAWRTVGLGVLSVLLFLPLYFTIWLPNARRRQAAVILVTMLGLGFSWLSGGGATFILYAAAMAPFAFEARRALLFTLAQIGLYAEEMHLHHISPLAAIWVGVVSAGLCAANIYAVRERQAQGKLRMAQEEVERLAKIAERERIARDLHDVLGHTLSLIVLKSELAGRLLDRDQERARKELQDVEETARRTLADVRQAIRGYRSEGLVAEVERARLVLTAAGVEPALELGEVSLGPSTETVLSLALREAVTNIVRHAQATRCTIRVQQFGDELRVIIEDNGRAAELSEGNGLRGMRERVEALGGTLGCETGGSTRIRISLPVNAATL